MYTCTLITVSLFSVFSYVINFSFHDWPIVLEICLKDSRSLKHLKDFLIWIAFTKLHVWISVPQHKMSDSGTVLKQNELYPCTKHIDLFVRFATLQEVIMIRNDVHDDQVKIEHIKVVVKDHMKNVIVQQVDVIVRHQVMIHNKKDDVVVKQGEEK